ncbi:linear amide C-N hydrolase [Cyanobacterium aponinum AL20118]|uniref:Linear amide C-N hydrolase n=2 Tax=Cyanobacterium aponinum TaxID=379064 RepID=A0A844H198_9CHRO|nr:linear amide C-N hydrolase [Cyanobacterium aponinum]MBD2394361.1 linear amide C-N hydrolase [Cyanobacterium aponinum FACHB-4101]MTF40135.1 linear amide C-N hydrolase [Cyanobacterium aponinum 0216]PHV62824.1 linear amide C-N hydrolase [Cyanobacterium aponinum IPPAS B-1201]WPF88562.1 linear amide C-N hydrolase [Cyanobacterium aponinum AL20115]
MTFLHILKSISLVIPTTLTLSALFGLSVLACTRVVYSGSDNTVITGRSMDWKEDIRSNLWVFPRGRDRNGLAGENSIEWKSKYGSVVVTGYDIGTADGMNEKGLVANLLYLAESDYGDTQGKPTLSMSLWAQYVLDNYATVAQAVEELKNEPFRVITSTLPNGSQAQLHLAISDSSGDSAIFEYIDGKLVIHHSKEYKVVTNSPIFEKQLALNQYWQSIGGLNFLPGTNRAADRFARAYFLLNSIPKQTVSNYISAVPEQKYQNQALASVLSVVRSVSVPLGITTPDQPNIASTVWRVVADQKNMTYYFDSATSPNVFWIDFSQLDFSPTASVKKLSLTDGTFYAGDATDNLVSETPFQFLPVE